MRHAYFNKRIIDTNMDILDFSRASTKIVCYAITKYEKNTQLTNQLLRWRILTTGAKNIQKEVNFDLIF